MDGAPGRAPARQPAEMSDDALVALWRAHRRWVAAVAYAHKPKDVDLEDLLQDIAVKLMRNIHTLADHESLRPWLRTVAMNAARSAGRRTRSRTAAERALRDAHSPDRRGDHGSEIAQPGIRRAVEDAASRGRRALELADTLPLHYREPLLLSLRGLSQKQIAHAMGLPVTTIETRLIRARRMIHQELAAEDADASRGTQTAPAAASTTEDRFVGT